MDDGGVLQVVKRECEMEDGGEGVGNVVSVHKLRECVLDGGMLWVVCVETTGFFQFLPIKPTLHDYGGKTLS